MDEAGFMPAIGFASTLRELSCPPSVLLVSDAVKLIKSSQSVFSCRFQETIISLENTGKHIFQQEKCQKV